MADVDGRAHSRTSNGDYRIKFHTETHGSLHPPSANDSFQRSPLHARVQNRTQRTRQRARSTTGEESLAGLPLEVQEALIIEDLLSVLMGIEGTYVTVHPDYIPDDPHMQLKGARFVVASQLDPSLRDFVSRILPLSTYFTAISSFIELRGPLEYGLVNHALCAALREMLKDYYILLAQLENAFNSSTTFSLQKLWFYVHPTLHTLSLMYGLITELAEADDEATHSGEGSDSDLDGDDDEALGIASGVKAVLSQLDGVGGGGIIKGGEVVAVLWQRMAHMSGDPSARTLYSSLLRRTARPYAEGLQRWIATGELEDPYGEFMVKEAKFIQRSTLDKDFVDEYWERRYTLRDGSTLAGAVKRQQAGVPAPRKPGGRLPGGACVPPPLESWKHKILLAGKYLNVIQECGMEVERTNLKVPSDEQTLAIDDERFYKSVESAYTHANTTLLKLLLEDQQLVLRLRTMRHFFFLCQSSFLTQFLDLAASELRKSARSANLTKLQSLLDLALKDDGNPELCREDIKVTMATSGLYEWLLKVVSVSGALEGGDSGTGGWDANAVDIADDAAKDAKEREKDKDKKPLVAIDALTLDFAVKFPLSLVLSKKTILRYQLLFRFLLHLKHVEMSLSAMWTEHTQPIWRSKASTVPEELERWRRRVFVLRARMLAFVQQLLAFATSEVLEPHWRTLEAKLARVQTVDQLLRDHVDFLDTCLKECMLTSSKLLKAYSKLVVTCSTFAVYTASFSKSAAQAVSDPNVTPMEKRWEFLSKFESNFNHWLKTFIDCVSFYSSTDNIQLLALVVRLNSVQTTSGGS
ncbi:Spc97/Spc98 [Auriculariales sp. MPI-PUGE-AT-0066]|nr:Spc97/Spc98 [Auriculariales sp. MPI-PUGE-AT-0066]